MSTIRVASAVDLSEIGRVQRSANSLYAPYGLAEHLDALSTHPEPVDEGADASVPLRELCNRVLAHVPEEDRQVAIEVLLHEREHDDVALSLDVSQKTVQRRLHRFLERARSYLGGSSS